MQESGLWCFKYIINYINLSISPEGCFVRQSVIILRILTEILLLGSSFYVVIFKELEYVHAELQPFLMLSFAGSIGVRDSRISKENSSLKKAYWQMYP